jgi:hypothetical protein
MMMMVETLFLNKSNVLTEYHFQLQMQYYRSYWAFHLIQTYRDYNLKPMIIQLLLVTTQHLMI